MKPKNQGGATWSFVARWVLCVLLVIGIAFATPGQAEACGYHTHAHVGRLAANILHQQPYAEEYADLIRIIDTYAKVVEAGEVYPDWGYAAEYAGLGCGQTCLDASELAHGNIMNSPTFQEVLAQYQVYAVQSSSRSETQEQRIAFLLGVIGHNVQDAAFDNGIMVEDQRVEGNDPHELVDLAVNAFTINDLGGYATPSLWYFPLNDINDAYYVMGKTGVGQWLSQGTSASLLKAYNDLETASIGYYGIARYGAHTWLYGQYQNYPYGGLNDLANRTAVAWMQIWDWMSAYTPVSNISLSPSMPDGQQDWYRQTVTMNFTAGDNFDGQLMHITTDPISTLYSVDGAPYQKYVGEFTISTDGVHPISYYAVDSAGNFEPFHHMTVNVDKNAPVIQLSIDKVRYSKADILTVHFSGSDAVSGLSSLTAEFNGQPVVNGQTISLLSLPLGAYTLTVRAEDLAGNRTEISQSIELTPVMIYLPFAGTD